VTGTATGRPLLVTGGAGFIGCNLADRLAAEGHDVLVLDSLARAGAAENLAWLRRRQPRRISAVTADIRDEAAVAEVAREAGAVFHLAAQVAVTTSLAAPLEDFEVNLRGTLLLLEALRRSGEKLGKAVPLIFASTNKVYGDLADIPLALNDGAWAPEDVGLRSRGVGEGRKLDFHTPYGCSKGGADQYVLDYARSYGLPACVLRMSCIYGTRQRGTEDQGWVAHFLLAAMAGRPVTIYGDGRQVRDVLFIDDAISAYLAAWRRAGAVAGRAFNLGGGPGNAVSLLQVLDELERLLGRPVARRFAPWRPGDQRWFVADTSAAHAALGLAPPLPWREGLARLAAWAAAEHPMTEVAA
jgi:CDP-paratose 2-epimerase